MYQPDVQVGGPATAPQERFVRHVAQDLLLDVARRLPTLQRRFHDVDPERRHLVNKEQFMNALSSVANHLTGEAIDYLWAVNFESKIDPKMVGAGASHSFDHGAVDWR